MPVLTALTPQEIRARMAAGYKEAYRKAGIAASDRELEQLAAADCELVDAARAAGELSAGPRPDAPAQLDPTRQRPDPVQQACHSAGVRLGGVGRPTRFRALHGDPMLIGARWGAAVARIQQILERVARAPTLERAIAGAEYPRLAKEFGELWSYYMTRDALPPPNGRVDHNVFRGMSDKDASKKFIRLVEDICDRSTAALGPWWVK